MKLLVLSFNYRPDLCAGSFRTSALVDALRAHAPDGTQIDVVTTSPNRYSSYSAHASDIERHAGLDIYRVRLPAHANDMLGQSRAFLSYAVGAYRYARSRKYDLVYASSARLMTAALGARIARMTGAKLYLDIRDIFVDTIKDVLPTSVAGSAQTVFDIVERRTMSAAHKINLVSEGFRGYFKERYPEADISYFTNGIDDEFVTAADTIDSGRKPSRPVRVLYAGNIGEGQGLHAIIPELARRMTGRAAFVIIGDGGRRYELQARLAAAGVDNVTLTTPVDRARLIEQYRAADVLFLHLNAHEAFEKVLPSKLFEYAAMGKPIWAGVAGFPARFVEDEIENAAVFRPCDVEDAERAFGKLALADGRRTAFLAKYTRAAIAAEIAGDILTTARR